MIRLFAIRLFALLAVLVCAAPALAQQLPAGVNPQDTILIDTKYGRVVVKLRSDIAPKHAERIKTLARDKFYDNVPFHRVIGGFMAQTGDGQNGNGTGGSKYANLPRRVPQRQVHGGRRGRLRHGRGRQAQEGGGGAERRGRGSRSDGAGAGRRRRQMRKH